MIMRKLTIIFLFLMVNVWFALGWTPPSPITPPDTIPDAVANMNFGILGGNVPAGEAPATPDLFYESFGTDSDEYDHTMPCGDPVCWTEDQGAGNTVNADYATGFAGAALEIDMAATTTNANSQAFFSEISAVHYIQLRFKVIDWDKAATWGETVWYEHGAPTYGFKLYTYNETTNFELHFADTDVNTYDAGDITDGNFHHIVIKCPSDATTDITYKLDGGAETTATDVECNVDPTSITLGADAAYISDDHDFVFDDVGICSEANKANCGW